MAIEIERKFLVRDDSWQAHVYRSAPLRQGYLVSDKTRSVRVRITADTAQLNIKSGTLGVSRREYEYPIPLRDAEDILNTLCRKPLLEKTRHWLRHGNHIWEIDVFAGDNAGLVVAEVELNAPDEPLELPSWVGKEVSHDIRYYNSCLVRHPYKNW